MAELAYYGDDVTGSVDVLLQSARRGLSGRLFIGLPEGGALAEAAAAVDVVGVAGIARSLPTDDLDAEVRPALAALRRTGAPVVQYKACSTVDSSPAVGSLGRVLEIGREVFGEATIPMLFAQPDFGRYTAFGHHFAAEGGDVHRLDRQPTMSTHPSTPIDESDIARFLSRQTRLPIGAVTLPAYTSAARIREEWAASGAAAVVFDALDDDHLGMIGEAISTAVREAVAEAGDGSGGDGGVSHPPRPLFVIGSGGLSRAVALTRTSAATLEIQAPPPTGPALVVSGSRSPASRRQALAAADAGWLVTALPSDTADDEAAGALREGRSVVLTAADAHLTADAEPLAVIAQAAASAIGAAVRSGLTRRVVVCGGDTSGRVVRLLGIRSLSIAAPLGGNVVLLRAHADDPAIDGVEILLKGGQVGTDDLFERVRLAGG